jgi:hypothetical protein
LKSLAFFKRLAIPVYSACVLTVFVRDAPFAAAFKKGLHLVSGMSVARRSTLRRTVEKHRLHVFC